MNTRIEYLYRDASNYKQWHSEVVEGELVMGQVECFLIDGDGFIPSCIGLMPLQGEFSDGITDDDHIWHEIAEIELTEVKPTIDVTANEMLERMRKAHERGWDENLAVAEMAKLPESETFPPVAKAKAILTKGFMDTWLGCIWDALEGYRENCIPDGNEEYDKEYDDIKTAMAWIREALELPDETEVNQKLEVDMTERDCQELMYGEKEFNWQYKTDKGEEIDIRIFNPDGDMYQKDLSADNTEK